MFYDPKCEIIRTILFGTVDSPFEKPKSKSKWRSYQITVVILK